MDTLHALVHLLATHKWFRGQDDVTGAFLHAKLKEIVYMQQLEGFGDSTDHVLQILLSLYGLKQAA